MKNTVVAACLMVLMSSCNNVKEKAKDTINKGGETVGEIATEFTEGITEGVDRTLESKLELSQALKDKGISTGKYYIESDTLAKDNKLVIYLINEKPFTGTLTFKVLDKKGTEFGRKQLTLNNDTSTAAYYDVVFDKRTNIEVKSTIQID